EITMRAWWKKIDTFANKHELVLLLLLAALLLRIPSLFEPFWYGDENIYLAIGEAINKGAVLYRDITDFPNKPPLIYLLASWTGSVTGMRLLLLAWQAPAIVFFYSLALKLLRKVNGAFFATLVFVFFTSTPLIEGNIANAE